MIVCETRSCSHCVYGAAAGHRGYTTTISTGRGNYSTQFISSKIHLKRLAFDESDTNCHYEIELSNDADNLSGHDCKFIFMAGEIKKRNYFFGIKQAYFNNNIPFSGIKLGELENTDETKINIYPNALNVVVGIKFVDVFTGKFLKQISQYTSSDSFSAKKQRLQ